MKKIITMVLIIAIITLTACTSRESYYEPNQDEDDQHYIENQIDDSMMEDEAYEEAYREGYRDAIEEWHSALEQEGYDELADYIWSNYF